MYVCFVYYSKAFDSLMHNELWQIMRKMDFPGFASYLLRDPAKCCENVVWNFRLVCCHNADKMRVSIVTWTLQDLHRVNIARG